MIGPVFGHIKDQLTQSQNDLKYDGSLSEDSDSDMSEKRVKYIKMDREAPLGVIQLINKTGGKAITNYDKLKFEALQGLIGLSIDNATEQHSMLNIRVGIYQRMIQLNQSL